MHHYARLQGYFGTRQCVVQCPVNFVEPFWACPPPPYTSSRLRMPSMHTSHRARMQTQQRLYALIIYISLACMQWHNQCTASFMLSKG
eukprot:scaffold60924_cov19-Tisochrysis_lutea.AAC.1